MSFRLIWANYCVSYQTPVQSSHAMNLGMQIIYMHFQLLEGGKSIHI